MENEESSEIITVGVVGRFTVESFVKLKEFVKQNAEKLVYTKVSDGHLYITDKLPSDEN